MKRKNEELIIKNVDNDNNNNNLKLDKALNV